MITDGCLICDNIEHYTLKLHLNLKKQDFVGKTFNIRYKAPDITSLTSTISIVGKRTSANGVTTDASYFNSQLSGSNDFVKKSYNTIANWVYNETGFEIRIHCSVANKQIIISHIWFS